MQYTTYKEDTLNQVISFLMRKIFANDITYINSLFSGTSPIARAEDLKEAKERMLDAINEAGITLSLPELTKQLNEMLGKLDTAFADLQKAGRDFVVNYFCDDKTFFTSQASYIRKIHKVGCVVNRVFRIFSNTRRHERTKHYDSHYNQEKRSLYTLSPLGNDSYLLPLFDIEEFDKGFQNLIEVGVQLLSTINNIYNYAISVDKYCAIVKQRPHLAMNYMHESVAEELGATFDSTLVPLARQSLSPKVLDDFQMLQPEQFSCKLYHELPKNLFHFLAILLKDRTISNNGLTPIEMQIFAHFPTCERMEKAEKSRILIDRFDELCKVIYSGNRSLGPNSVIAIIEHEIGNGNQKGDMYSESDFVNTYIPQFYHGSSRYSYHRVNSYTAQIHQGKFTEKIRAFDKKKEEILKRCYPQHTASTQVTSTPQMSFRPGYSSQYAG